MEFKSGDDFLAEGASMHTYGISIDTHNNMIEVHGDAALRDEIVTLLNVNNSIILGHKVTIIDRFFLWMLIGAGLMALLSW